MSGKYKSVTLTKLISKPELTKSGKVMKCQASIDGSDAIELAFYPDKLPDIVEGALLAAEFKDATDNYAASWFTLGKSKYPPKSSVGGGYNNKKDGSAIAAQSALKSAVEYSKSLPDCAPEDVTDVANRFLKWLKENSKE